MTTTNADRLRSLYTSLPLRRDAKEIRVIHLAPVSLELPDDPIHGTLEVVNIDARPRFVALSYVWGTWSHPPRTITCGQHQIDVTDNLFDAMDHLRCDPKRGDPGRNDDGSMTIWIDALCINQDDEDEKLAQIALMGDIYGSSFSTCIWLGKGSPETDEAARLARVLGWQELFQPEGDFFYEMPSRSVIWKASLRQAGFILRLGLRDTLTYIRCKTGKGDSESAAASGNRSFMDINGGMSCELINLILQNIWLRRIWTLQEVALSPNPWLRCGSQCLTWRTMLYSVAYLEWGSHNRSEFGFTGTLYRSWQRAMNLWFTIAQPPRQQAVFYQPALGSLSSSNFEQALSDYHRFLGEVKTRSERIQYASILFLPAFVVVTIMVVVNISHNIRATGRLVARIVLGPWLAGLLCLVIPLLYWHQKHNHVRSKQTVLAAFIQEVCVRDATEPRDKACGVHAILAELGVHLQPPEKTSTRGLLYRELLLELLNATKDLNLILGAGNFFPDQPSWIPDWALERTRHWIPPPGWLEDTPERALSILQLEFLWGRCTMKSPAKFDIHDHRELIVEGFKIGMVSWVGEPFVPVDDDFESGSCSEMRRTSLAHNIQILQETLRKKREQRKSDGKPPRHHWYAVPPAPPYVLQAPNDTLVPFHSLDYLEGQKMCATADSVDWERPASEIATMLGEHQPVWGSHVNKVCNGFAEKKRTLFWSEDVPFTGLGNCPVGTRPGDEVVLLSGVKLPVLLRKIQGEHSYYFLGYAIMDFEDVMDGRIWKKRFSLHQGADATRFVLS